MKTYIRKLGGKWYAFAANAQMNIVFSIGSDNPKNGARWIATWNDNGIKYVSSPSASRSAAYKKAYRYGQYSGEI